MGNIWVGRHGRTKFNVNNQGSKELLRGWLDVPLDDQGLYEADILADYLWRYSEGVEKVWASNLSRTEITAKPIAKSLQVPVVPTIALRAWNLGDLQGQPVDDANFLINHRVMSAPDEPVPGGESFNEFQDRVLEFFDERLKEAAYSEGDQILITHYRTVKLIQGYIDGLLKKVSIPSFLAYNIQKTGELMRVFKAAGGWVYQMIPMQPTSLLNKLPDQDDQ